MKGGKLQHFRAAMALIPFPLSRQDLELRREGVRVREGRGSKSSQYVAVAGEAVAAPYFLTAKYHEVST